MPDVRAVPPFSPFQGPSSRFDTIRAARPRAWRQPSTRAIYHRSNVQTIRVSTPTAKYDVITGSGLLKTLAARMERALGKGLPRRVFVLTSPAIWALWSRQFLASFTAGKRELPIVLFLEPGERFKTLASVEKILRQMAEAGGDRGSLLIAFGGGIVGDVGGGRRDPALLLDSDVLRDGSEQALPMHVCRAVPFRGQRAARRTAAVCRDLDRLGCGQQSCALSLAALRPPGRSLLLRVGRR